MWCVWIGILVPGEVGFSAVLIWPYRCHLFCLRMLLLFFLQVLVPSLPWIHEPHSVLYLWLLLPQLAATLGKALGVLGSHGGQQGTKNIYLCWQNGSSGSWCSSPWSPSLFKWRKWDLTTIAIILRWKVPQYGRQEKQERVSCCAAPEDKVAKTKPVLMGHYAGEFSHRSSPTPEVFMASGPK